MASLTYLWTNRARFSFGSKAFLKCWAKRVLLLPGLFRRNNRKFKLTRAGAIIDRTAEIGETRVDGDKHKLKIGAFSSLGKATIALHDTVTIGDYVCINDNVIILTASHGVSDPEWKHVKAPIIIEDYAWIATNAILLPGVRIGRGAVVGAGAVVARNVEPGAIVTGNPAKPTGKKRSDHLDYNPCAFLAENNAWLVG